MPGSGIREIFNLVAGRDDVLHLEVGEPDFDPPEHVVEAGVAAARRGVGYTQTAGLLELREALCEKLHRVNGLDYTPDQVLVTQGGAEAVAALFAAAIALLCAYRSAPAGKLAGRAGPKDPALAGTRA